MYIAMIILGGIVPAYLVVRACCHKREPSYDYDSLFCQMKEDLSRKEPEELSMKNSILLPNVEPVVSGSESGSESGSGSESDKADIYVTDDENLLNVLSQMDDKQEGSENSEDSVPEECSNKTILSIMRQIRDKQMAEEKEEEVERARLMRAMVKKQEEREAELERRS